MRNTNAKGKISVQAAERLAPSWSHRLPHVLVIDRDIEYGRLLAQELQVRSFRAEQFENVDAFLDLNGRERIDLVSLEVDPMDPDTLDNIRLLRTHFGEWPGTRIVASSSFMPGAFPTLVEQSGADTCVAKLRAPEAMASVLEAEVSKHIKSQELGPANEPRHSE